MATYQLTGNTYRNRDMLKQSGAQWDADARQWELRISGNGAYNFLRRLAANGITATQKD